MRGTCIHLSHIGFPYYADVEENVFRRRFIRTIESFETWGHFLVARLRLVGVFWKWLISCGICGSAYCGSSLGKVHSLCSVVRRLCHSSVKCIRLL